MLIVFVFNWDFQTLKHQGFLLGKFSRMNLYLSNLYINFTDFCIFFRFGKVPFKFAMTSVNCKGDEATIQECLHRKFDFCGETDGVQIECQ